jgi:hypothetical protein
MKKTRGFKARRQTILIGAMVLLTIFLTNFVSSFEFDNVKNYNSTTKTVTIVNAFGLPVIGTEIVKIKLNTPTMVKTGYGGIFKVAEFEITSLEDYSDVFDGIEFYDVNNGMNEIERIYEYKVKGLENYSVNDYKKECSLLENKTEICKKIISGTHEEQREVWTPLGRTDFLSGEVITIGIFTYVNRNDYIEWIPTFYGVKINEWATWVGGLNNGLVTYYKLDETTGAVKDERNLNNGTAYVTRGVTGKLGTAYNFTDTSAEKVFSSNPTGLNGVGLSGTLWIYALSQNSGSLVFIDGNGDESMNFGFTGSQIKMNCWDTGQSYNTGYDATSYLNKWTFVYWEMNSTRTRVYLDGTLVIDTSGAFTGFSSSVVNLSLGSAFYSPDIVPNSIIDEVGIWNRTLTTQEQGYLYNAGNGCTYNNENCFVPPTSAFCNFTGYVKDSAGNGLNGANVIIINQTDNKMYYNVTSDANGFWSKNITNSNGTSSSQLYTVLAYFNNSLVGGIKPYVNSTCP